MNITIINGNEERDIKFEDELLYIIKHSNKNIRMIKLRDYQQKPCVGCLGCWFKTPGVCVAKDDTSKVTREVLSSDFVIYASKIKLGFISPRLKVCFDKHIPVSLPYFEIVDGEVHHVRRTENFPNLALIVDRPNNFDSEDLEILTKYFERFAINYRKKPEFVKTIDSKKEIINAINAS